MISLNEKRFESQVDRHTQVDDRHGDNENQQAQIAAETLARVRKFAVEKPLVVVIAGLAVGVLSGLMLKRR